MLLSRAPLQLSGGLLLVVCLAGQAAAQARSPPQRGSPGKHCLDEDRPKLILDQTLYGVINPLGAEHLLRLSLCLPLIRQPGPLFDYTNVEVGLVSYLAPAYVHQGAFVGLQPLSILRLRAEFTGLYYWPLPLPAAGYFPLSGYDADFRREVLPPENAGTVGGYDVLLSATLQFAVPLGQRLQLLVLDELSGDHFVVGSAPFYYNLRRDVVLARDDWVLRNAALALLEFAIRERLSLRVGATDDLYYVPQSGYRSNVVAALLALLIRREHATVRSIQPFVRLGGFTEHAFRRNDATYGGANLVGGVNVVYELYRAP